MCPDVCARCGPTHSATEVLRYEQHLRCEVGQLEAAHEQLDAALEDARSRAAEAERQSRWRSILICYFPREASCLICNSR